MRITEVSLLARDLDEAERFYRDRLGLPVERTANQVAIRIGSSRLVFDSGPFEGVHHLAFTIPTGSFRAARAWLEKRCDLLSLEGRDEFEGPPSWDSRSLYFDGPDGQVLELIERRRLPTRSDEAFGAESMLCVSEVGLAVPDVLAAVVQLAAVNAAAYGSEPATDFAAVGDDEGLLILATSGRAWMPTDRGARPSATAIAADGVGAVRVAELQSLNLSSS